MTVVDMNCRSPQLDAWTTSRRGRNVSIIQMHSSNIKRCGLFLSPCKPLLMYLMGEYMTLNMYEFNRVTALMLNVIFLHDLD